MSGIFCAKVKVLCRLSDVDKIKYTIWRIYFSFFQGIKSANTIVFKDFYNEEKRERQSHHRGQKSL
jgi:hypothetical protein